MPADMPVARELLRRSLHKAGDGPASRYLNRPISTRVSMALAPLRLSPDLVSFVALLLGVTAAVLLGFGYGIAGGIVVHLTSVIDGVDGELARLQLRARPAGALLDGVLDRLADAAILAGLGVWALAESSDQLALILAVCATAGALLSMASKDRIAALGLPPAPERRLGFLLGGRDGRLLIRRRVRGGGAAGAGPGRGGSDLVREPRPPRVLRLVGDRSLGLRRRAVTRGCRVQGHEQSE